MTTCFLLGNFPLTFPLSAIIGPELCSADHLRFFLLLTRVQSRSAQTRNLWPQLLAPPGRSKAHRKREPRKAAAPGRPPDTGCRTGWSGRAPEWDGNDLKISCAYFYSFTLTSTGMNRVCIQSGQAKQDLFDKMMMSFLTLFFLLARFILSIPIPRSTNFIEVRRLSKTAGYEGKESQPIVSGTC